MSASRKIRSPSVTMPTSLPSSTTGAPEIPDSAKSLIAPSTVSSGPSVGHSACEISATLNSLISCCSMLHPTNCRSRYCKRPGEPPVKASTSAYGFDPCGPPSVEVELDERAVENDRTAGGDRDPMPITQEQGEEIIPFEANNAFLQPVMPTSRTRFRRAGWSGPPWARAYGCPIQHAPSRRDNGRVPASRSWPRRGSRRARGRRRALNSSMARSAASKGDTRPLDEYTPEHVGDAQGNTAGLENAQAQPGLLIAEVGGTHHPVLFFEELFVSIGVEGVVAEGEKVNCGEQGGALAGDTTPRRGRVLGVGDDGISTQLFTQPWNKVQDGRASRGSDDVPDEEQPEPQSSSPTARGR